MRDSRDSRPSPRSVALPRLFTIAFRNLGRHRRRTVMTSTCVAASAAAIVAFMGYYRGTYDQMFYGALIDYQTAHAQIQSATLDPDDPAGWARPEQTLTGWEAAAAAARRAPRAKGVAPRLELACFAGDGIEKLPALFAGVDFAAEAAVSVFANSVVRGALPSERGQVLIGDDLGELFSVEPGSQMLVQSTTSSGAPNIARFTVSGLYDSGFSLLDSSFLAAPLADAQELADAPGAINRIYVKLASMDAVDGAMDALESAARLAGAVAKPWTWYAVDAINHAKTETIFYYVFLAILVLVSSSAIASTMRVAAFERVREIGTIRAEGWTRADVFGLFFIESGAVGLLRPARGLPDRLERDGRDHRLSLLRDDELLESRRLHPRRRDRHRRVAGSRPGSSAQGGAHEHRKGALHALTRREQVVIMKCMRHSRFGDLRIAGLSLAFALAAPIASAQAGVEINADEILRRMDEAMAYDECEMRVSIQDTKPSGASRELEADVWYAKSAGTMIAFVAPAREKGKRILMIGESMWMATPGVSKPIRLSGKEAFMGTSFTNDDLMNLDKSDDYDARIVSSSEEGWKLELIARRRSLPYQRVALSVSKGFLPMEQTVFLLSGEPSKTIEFSEPRDYGGKTRPSVLRVVDAMKKGAATVVTFSSIVEKRIDRSKLSPDRFMK
jgi:ABC-type lipoprotein release transport system permease subunit/outer membrane lipoprotein-sorting protein